MNKFSLPLLVCGLWLGSCCNEDFIMPDYDFIAYALDVTDLIDIGCSGDPIYTTEGATPDGVGGSCWPNSGTVSNRWFKFRAPYSYIGINVNIGGGQGTQSATNLALWDTNGTDELSCGTFISPSDNVSVSYGFLTAGEWYYFSVDVDTSDTAGTFSLCLYSD